MTDDRTVDEVHAFPPRMEAPLEPAPLFGELRGRCPVARVRMATGDEAWLVTGYEDNRQIFADPRLSRAAAAAAGAPRARAIPLERNAITTLDPPEHTRLRRAVLPWFTPAAAEQARPRLAAAAGALLDRVPEDLVSGYAQPLALRVITELLDIPEADRNRFDEWTDAYLGLSAADPERIARARDALTEYLTTLIEARRANPAGDDMLTGLAGGALTDEELVAMAVTLAVAGYQTTANEIAASIVALLSHPGQYQRLCTGAVPMVTAVEELLRFTPIAASGGTIRVALDDLEVGGVTVRAGEGVLPSTTSANRDGRVFADPDGLDLGRKPNPHMAFGHGTHRCLGAHLARVVLQVALGELTVRCPGLRLAVPVEEIPWETDRMIRGPRCLPVRWG
jgi:nocardicin N-oxygenase